MGLLDWLIPQRQTDVPAEAAQDHIGDFEGLPVGPSGHLIGGDETYDHYRDYLANDGLFDTVRFDDAHQRSELVNPERIEGVNLSGAARRDPGNLWNDGPDVTVTDPESFWSMSRHSRDDYLELTSHLPEINRRLEGHTAEEQAQLLDEMREDASLRDCIDVCYAPRNQVKVWEVGDFYEFDGDGRHRVIAARINMEDARAEAEQQGQPFCEDDYALPVRVIGRLDLNRERAMEADGALEWAGYPESSREESVPEWSGYGEQAGRDAPSEGVARGSDLESYRY